MFEKNPATKKLKKEAAPRFIDTIAVRSFTAGAGAWQHCCSFFNSVLDVARLHRVRWSQGAAVTA